MKGGNFLDQTAMVLFGLSCLVATAVVSLAFGYAFGQRALSGVSTPVTSDGRPRQIRDPRTIPLVNEAEVIAKVKSQLAAGIPTPPPTPSPSPTPVDLFAATPTPMALELSPELAPVALASPSPLPQSGSGARVVWQVVGVERRGEELVLSVQIQNQSQQPARFLYSYLSVTNDANQPIAARTQGLPGELPPQSNPFLGTIRIPVAALGSSRSLSLSLADYPSGQNRLEIRNLPIP
ncbi:MAG: hypothetical protein Q6L49_02895 [Thermostichales cyanobacterium HHBFW_bins_127]